MHRILLSNASQIFYRRNLLNLKIVAVSAVLLSVAVLHSQAPASKPPMPTSFRFLNPSDINPAQLLPPPPKDGSPEQQREMAEVKRIIQTRTKERHDQAIWDARHEDPTPFVAVLGSNVDLGKLPATSRLLADIMNDQAAAASRAKEYFHRKFPIAAAMPADSFADWTCDEKVRRPEAFPLRSYPSGHTTMAFTIGVVLSGLVPEKSQEILARSASYAYSREVCGDHYHSDVEAGHVLGTTLGVLFLHNKALKPELDAAKAELKSAGIAQ
jgi:acid phosphatase (class A)